MTSEAWFGGIKKLANPCSILYENLQELKPTVTLEASNFQKKGAKERCKYLARSF